MSQNRALRQKKEIVRVPGDDIDYGLLNELVGFWVRRAEVRVMESFRQYLSSWAVSPTEVAILIIVENNPGLSQIELAGALNTDQSTVVNPLEHLETREFIARSRLASDRRYQVLELTESGHDVVKQIKDALLEHHNELTAELSARERRAFMDLLKRFVQG